MTGKFYMVWRDGGNIPVVKHKIKKIALMECERLAALHPGNIFYALEAIGMKFKMAPKPRVTRVDRIAKVAVGSSTATRK